MDLPLAPATQADKSQDDVGGFQLPAGSRRAARLMMEHATPGGVVAVGVGAAGLYTAKELARRQAKQESAQKAEPFTR